MEFGFSRINSFSRPNRALPFGKKRATNLANRPVATPGRAVLASIINDPQVQRVPMLLGEKFFQIRLGLFDASTVGQLPTLSQAMDVRVHRKSWNAERLCHHD